MQNTCFSHLCAFIVYAILFYMTYNAMIFKVDYDLSGYGSMNETTKGAKAIDKSINLIDVKEWFDSRVKSKSQVKGANSFVARGPYQEYQLDLMVIKRWTIMFLRDGNVVHRRVHRILGYSLF